MSLQYFDETLELKIIEMALVIVSGQGRVSVTGLIYLKSHKVWSSCIYLSQFIVKGLRLEAQLKSYTFSSYKPQRKLTV